MTTQLLGAVLFAAVAVTAAVWLHATTREPPGPTASTRPLPPEAAHWRTVAIGAHLHHTELRRVVARTLQEPDAVSPTARRRLSSALSASGSIVIPQQRTGHHDDLAVTRDIDVTDRVGPGYFDRPYTRPATDVHL